MNGRLTAPLLVLAACAGHPRSVYVPGGTGLPVSARRVYRHAVAAARHGEGARARQILDRLCTHHPLRLGFHLFRLRVAKERDGGEAAARLYEPAPPGMHAERARVLAGLARLDEADLAPRRELFLFAISQEPGEPLWLVGLAGVDLQLADRVGRRAQRERELGSVDRAASSLVETRRIFDRIEVHLNRALDLDPDLAEAHLLLGYLATRRADLSVRFEEADDWRHRAEQEYRRAIALDPESLEAHFNLAENHLYFDLSDDAISELTLASRLAPKEARVWRGLGLARYKAGHLDRATKAYRRAIELDPLDADVRVALADCLRRSGRGERATDQLLQARRDAAGDPNL
ncbi:MAG: tetratricopeptide repeat protein, partial [Planctomycetota bacterium]